MQVASQPNRPAGASADRVVRRLGRAAAAAVFAWVLLGGQRAGAVDGTLHRVAGAGLKMTIDTRWPALAGYRPVQIVVEPVNAKKPTAADRVLTVEFTSKSRRYYREEDVLTVSQPIALPAGFKQVSTTLSVPQVNPWTSYNVQVLEDGVPVPSLSPGGTGMNYGNYGGYEYIESLPSVLFVGGWQPGTGQLAAALPSEAVSNVSSYSGGGSRLPTAHALAAEELPQKWIDYSGIDVICLSLDEFTRLKTGRKKAFDAIRRWTAAGGNLWIYGIGDNWQRTAELEELLGLPSGLDENGQPLKDVWQPPDPSHRGRVAGRELLSEYGDTRTVERPDREPAIESGTAGAGFLLRRYDLGLVAALAAEDPFPGQQADWALLLNAVGSDRWSWYRRHGMSTMCDNPDYTNFLIPGVGMAPVAEFCILITLFVLAIGPLNYWLLRRWKRLHLLVVTIPAGAAAVTLLLFAYALISDGLGTRVRVRSVTYLDQRRGHAACWARMTYYAGLAPGGGLTFPDDVAVQPLQMWPQQDDVRNYRWMHWEGDQRLTSGWISSRTQVQYLTVRSRRSRRGVRLLRSPHDPTKVQVKNELGTRIEQLAICDADGACYWAEGIDDEKTAGVRAADSEQEIRNRLSRLYAANRPKAEPGSDIAFYSRSRPYYYYDMSDSGYVSGPTQTSGRLEKSISLLGGLPGRSGKILQPQSYVAIVEQSPEVVHGTSAEEEKSFHVIIGTW